VSCTRCGGAESNVWAAGLAHAALAGRTVVATGTVPHDRPSGTFFERPGVHAVPRHWFEPVPDSADLTDEVFTRPSTFVGLDLRPEAQRSLLLELAAAFGAEYSLFPRHRGSTDDYWLDNDWFGPVDAELLYAVVRWLTPRKVIEIGTAFSWLLMEKALQKKRSEASCDAVHIGLDPSAGEVSEGLPGLDLRREKVQTVPLSLFEELQAGNILFIDSSHCVRTGGDVVYECLEVLPRLNPGVVVHIHDIFLPAEYPREWLLSDLHFPSGQYLLQAFLASNSEFEVLPACHAFGALVS